MLLHVHGPFHVFLIVRLRSPVKLVLVLSPSASQTATVPLPNHGTSFPNSPLHLCNTYWPGENKGNDIIITSSTNSNIHTPVPTFHSY